MRRGSVVFGFRPVICTLPGGISEARRSLIAQGENKQRIVVVCGSRVHESQRPKTSRP
jgi:hypothetical protein